MSTRIIAITLNEDAKNQPNLAESLQCSARWSDRNSTIQDDIPCKRGYSDALRCHE